MDQEPGSAESSEWAVSVKGLTRQYTTRNFFGGVSRTTWALSGVDFQVGEGELFGLIGPNGAGKTTTIKILTTLLTPTGGEAKILGLDVRKDLYAIRRRIGIVFGGERGLYNRVSAMDNLRYFSDLYGVESGVAKKRIPQLLEVVGLADRAQEKVEKYSRGMKQRLHIAKALVHDPELIFLDEPTIGLDPAGARDIRTMVRELKAQGKTILLTTHYMFEAEELCQRVGVISKGKIVALDTPSELKNMVRDISVIDLRTYGATMEYVEALRKLPNVVRVVADLDSEEQSVRVQTPMGADLLPQVVAALPQGAKIIDRTIKEPTLEDAYLRLVEE
ncbi:MAG: ABC transporter ATP-binding protein [Nitrososphaerota archaeon]|nr:ABC transporter ATP-binding protein [Nitrososphaerota archaeon]MDG6965949.1 ABC transporter ATP-binding protein [Nitrososphaerota archaeon]MDG6969295.1 ABC transporter ATP-binding protein [Nitrososphaerota archaeon]MDG6973919.1 ABC transporter ATP-binding protein [Nitrososphaerota archaeon]MDG7015332.1 ABC transporter ATP-binding protein [Nitrososphaerota archaeon]